MEKLIYFNMRLTDRLNMIKDCPMTIVSGRSGIGKSFAVLAYLQHQKTETIWHASRAVDFESYLREFQGCFTAADDHLCDAVQALFPSRTADPSGSAVAYAIALKQREKRNQLVYVLKYQEDQVPERIMDFLDILSSQRVRGFFVVLIVRRAPSFAMMERLGADINLIPENSFLLNPAEIRHFFQKNAITISDTEANYLYLLSAGSIPEVSRLYQVMRTKGKRTLYMGGRDAFSWDGSPEWTQRFLMEDDIWHLPILDKVRRGVEAMELEKACIEVERVRMKSEKFSPAYDLCDYYSAVLQMLSGNGKKALEELNRGFAHRIAGLLYQSAYRINMAQAQLKILMGENWFEEERDLLISFADRRIYDHQGISKTAAGLALWRAKESRKIIAYLGDTEEKDIVDAGYREYLLSMVYHEAGFEEQAILHYDAACKRNCREMCLCAILFHGAAANMEADMERKLGTVNHAGQTSLSPEFRDKLNRWRKAVYQNNVSDPRHGREALTAREQEIVECVGRRMSNKEIADFLAISENTVKTILKHVFAKLQISSRRELYERPARPEGDAGTRDGRS